MKNEKKSKVEVMVKAYGDERPVIIYLLVTEKEEIIINHVLSALVNANVLEYWSSGSLEDLEFVEVS